MIQCAHEAPVNYCYNRGTAKWYVALFVIVASLRHMSIINHYRLSDFYMMESTKSKSSALLEGDESSIILPSSLETEGWSDVKLLIYMTTHLPESHIAFFPCWKDAVERLEIFKYADLMLYTASQPTEAQLNLLPFRQTTIRLYQNPGYSEGAVQAMVDPFLENGTTWFDDYDWVIRVNPDVLIRNDTWLIQTMLNTSVDLILSDCWTQDYTVHSNPHFHTDFYAFRPRAVDRDHILQVDRSHAETHMTQSFRHVYEAGRAAWLIGAMMENYGDCRVAGVDSPVLHVHELSNYCPYYYNVTKEGFYR